MKLKHLPPEEKSEFNHLVQRFCQEERARLVRDLLFGEVRLPAFPSKTKEA